MYLKSLEMTGFKSFTEAKIEFPKGVTAVVGPNGTGKSNIVDSILWVLGEQSTKSLRSERMEDVIFNGTEARKPLGRVECSLVISGLGDVQIEGIPALPGPLGEYHEVMITRRLYRNGDSEYLINKALCRLKDVRSLLLETRAGIKGHTIIEQGRLDQILNASPRDRRELIEETAGIVRYKKQKAEALRKLESTQQNLLRVRDVVTEVRRQLNSLERQAQQARRYRRLSDEAKALEIRLLVRESRALVASKTQVEAELAELDAKEAAQNAEQARLESQVEEVKLRIGANQDSLNLLHEEVGRIEQEQTQALTAAEVERGRRDVYQERRAQASEECDRLTQEREQAEGAIMDVRARIAQAEAEMTNAVRTLAELEGHAKALAERRAGIAEREDQARQHILQSTVAVTSTENQLGQIATRREDLELGSERLAAEQADLAQQRRDAEQQLEHAARTRSDAERELEQLRQEREDNARTLERLESELHTCRARAERRQETLAAADSKLATLQGIVREDMGYGREGEEETTSVKACEGVREAIAEWLAVPPGLERAVEAILGERGRAWLVEAPNQAGRAIEFLKQQGLGRGSFVPVHPRWADHLGQIGAAAIHTRSGVVGWASDLVSAPEEARGVVACLFQGVLIVESLDVALTLWEHEGWTAPTGPKIVTLAGEIVEASGVVTGGAIETTVGLLQRRHEVYQLQAQRDELAAAAEELRAQRERLGAETDSSRAAVQDVEERIRTTDMRLLGLRKDAEGLAQRIQDLAQRLTAMNVERQRGTDEQRRLETELHTGREELERLTQQKAVREAALAELTATLAIVEGKSVELQGGLTQARLDAAAMQSRREHDESDLSRLLREQEERAARLDALAQQVSSLGDAAQRSEAERARNESLARELTQRANQVRADYVSLKERQAQDQDIARHLENGLGALRKNIATSREGRIAVEVRRAEIKTQLATVENTLSGTYQLSLDAALEQEAQQAAQAPPVEEGKTEEELGAALREQLQTVRGKLERMGPINLAAIEEHQALEERHAFLTAQEEDLTNSIKSLKEIIQRINKTTQRMFLETFNELQEKFGEVFGRFFRGGRAELVLIEPQVEEGQNGESSPEPGIDIVAQPPGKRLKSIAMLSGGEKTLTAMALLFASFLIRPTPFCILDEIDAPLDDENIARFAEVVRELSARAQFIVITHNKRTMAVADSLFGVTMEEPGVSQLLSLRVGDLQPA